MFISDSLYVLNGRDGNREWTSWLGDYPVEGQSAKLADIDPTSPGMELIVPLYYGDGRLRVFSADGRMLWEELVGEKILSVAVGDVDFDMCSDLMISTYSAYTK